MRHDDSKVTVIVDHGAFTINIGIDSGGHKSTTTSRLQLTAMEVKDRSTAPFVTVGVLMIPPIKLTIPTVVALVTAISTCVPAVMRALPDTSKIPFDCSPAKTAFVVVTVPPEKFAKPCTTLGPVAPPKEPIVRFVAGTIPSCSSYTTGACFQRLGHRR